MTNQYSTKKPGTLISFFFSFQEWPFELLTKKVWNLLGWSYSNVQWIAGSTCFKYFCPLSGVDNVSQSASCTKTITEWVLFSFIGLFSHFLTFQGSFHDWGDHSCRGLLQSSAESVGATCNSQDSGCLLTDKYVINTVTFKSVDNLHTSALRPNEAFFDASNNGTSEPLYLWKTLK